MVRQARSAVNLPRDIRIAFAELHERFEHRRRPIPLDLSIGYRLQPIAAEHFHFKARRDKALSERLGIENAAMTMMKIELV